MEKERYNLIMITLDCVRPDRLGCYGYGGVETPFINGLAADGIRFDQAVTHAPNTWVSHASLFTGHPPSKHGIRAASHVLSPDVITLAECLNDSGYRTAAFPGTSLIGKPQGFHRGFDLFDEPWSGQAPDHKTPSWRQNWPDVMRSAFDWIDGSKGSPFFLWLHYINTHHLSEYELPEYYRTRFSSDWQYYDGKISLADRECIGSLVGFLEDSGLDERTVVVVFADHGEELLEDGRCVHDGSLKEAAVRVPLIVRLAREMKNRLQPKGSVDGQVRLMDVYPTVCELIGIVCPKDLKGVSLVPLFSESTKGSRSPLDDEAAVAYMENLPKGYFGARTSQWKLILSHPPFPEIDPVSCKVEGLYDLVTDPEERVDLSQRRPSVTEHLKRFCMGAARSETPSLDLNPEDRERIEKALEDLGYLE